MNLTAAKLDSMSEKEASRRGGRGGRGEGVSGGGGGRREEEEEEGEGRGVEEEAIW